MAQHQRWPSNLFGSVASSHGWRKPANRMGCLDHCRGPLLQGAYVNKYCAPLHTNTWQLQRPSFNKEAFFFKASDFKSKLEILNVIKGPGVCLECTRSRRTRVFGPHAGGLSPRAKTAAALPSSNTKGTLHSVGKGREGPGQRVRKFTPHFACAHALLCIFLCC